MSIFNLIQNMREEAIFAGRHMDYTDWIEAQLQEVHIAVRFDAGQPESVEYGICIDDWYAYTDSIMEAVEAVEIALAYQTAPDRLRELLLV